MRFPYDASRSAPLAIAIRTIGIHAKTYFHIAATTAPVAGPTFFLYYCIIEWSIWELTLLVNKRNNSLSMHQTSLKYDRTTFLFQKLLRLFILDSYFVRDMGVVGAERIALTRTNHLSLCRLLMTFNQIGDNRS